MTSTPLSANKSTIDRHLIEPPPVWARALGWAAFRLFCTTPFRRRRPGAERALRARARLIDLTFEGRRLRAYQWGGRGPTVVLVHGWGGRATQFHPLVERLEAAGRRVVAFDLPGHGESGGHSTQLVQVSRAVRAVADVVGPIDAVVAHSLGAASSALAIADGLNVERVVMLAAASEPHLYWRKFVRWLRIGDTAKAAAEGWVRSTLGRGIDRLTIAESLRGYHGSLLFVHDRRDRVAPYDSVERLAQSREDARLLSTERLGHTRILGDTQVAASVAAFVTRDELSVGAVVDVARDCDATGASEAFERSLNEELRDPDLRWLRHRPSA